MKFQKLLVSTLTGCLLVGASSAAMARNDCPSGTITGGFHQSIVINEFASCDIVGVVVGSGGVTVRNADTVSMSSSLSRGPVRFINNVSAILVNNQVVDNPLLTIGGAFSTVVGNFVTGGDIRVNDDVCAQQQVVAVLRNEISDGNLQVNCNEKADVKNNTVTNGDITCRDNDRLDSQDNDAVGIGNRVNCSRNLF